MHISFIYMHYIDAYNLLAQSKNQPLQLQEMHCSDAPQQVPSTRTLFPWVSVLHCVSQKLDKHRGTLWVFVQGLAHKPLISPEIGASDCGSLLLQYDRYSNSDMEG